MTRFKSDVLNLYRSHVESLSRLPEFQKEEPAEDAPAEDEAAAAETTAAAVTEEIAEAQPAAADVDAEDETLRMKRPARSSGHRTRASSSSTRPRPLPPRMRLQRRTTPLLRA